MNVHTYGRKDEKKFDVTGNSVYSIGKRFSMQCIINQNLFFKYAKLLTYLPTLYLELSDYGVRNKTFVGRYKLEQQLDQCVGMRYINIFSYVAFFWWHTWGLVIVF